MKNVTISLSNDLVQVLDSLCKDCDLSRYAFAKEALPEKIERHSKNELKAKELDQEDIKKAVKNISEEEKASLPPFIRVSY